MTDEELDAIWVEHFGKVFRPKQTLACLRAVAERAASEEREAAILWLIDRAGQYDNGSGYVACLEERASEIRRGDHTQALASGDLDDLRPKGRRSVS